MISLSNFRENIFQNFKLMRDTGATFKVYHRRKVYNISVEPAEPSETESFRRDKPYVIDRKEVNRSDIKTSACALCNDVLVNGVCMNRSCKNAKVAK